MQIILKIASVYAHQAAKVATYYSHLIVKGISFYLPPSNLDLGDRFNYFIGVASSLGGVGILGWIATHSSEISSFHYLSIILFTAITVGVTTFISLKKMRREEEAHKMLMKIQEQQLNKRGDESDEDDES